MKKSSMNLNLDWNVFYQNRVRGLRKSGTNKQSGLCPFHKDTHPSFWFNTTNGLFKCEACGASGNATTFLARLEGIDTAEAYQRLLALSGQQVGIRSTMDQQQRRQQKCKEMDKQQKNQQYNNEQTDNWQKNQQHNNEPTDKQQKNQHQKFSMDTYSSLKKLPMEFLASLHISNTAKGIAIPYFDEWENLLCSRNRNGERSFSWAKGANINLYGLWKLREFANKDYIVLVEGESDAQTLWLNGIPALGVPGANTFRKEWADCLKGRKVYILKEPDQGGETFLRKTCEALRMAGFVKEVYELTIDGFKDPSDLFIACGDRFEDYFMAAIKAADEINLQKEGVLLTDAPVSLRIPFGYRISEEGIFQLDETSGTTNRICSTPILIARRLSSVETNEEKLEINYRKNGRWHSQIVQRSMLFQSKTIVLLSDIGVNVTSENARQLVLYLGKLLDENNDIIEVVSSVSQMGWHGNEFLPYLADNLVLDVDVNSRRWASAYIAKGTLQQWIDNISGCRKNDIFRFLLACSFAAPLLKKMNHRTFMVHNWGDSRFGKTAALKAALSVWGDPEGLMGNFNATHVGLERMASFYTDLPLGIDEKQVAGTKQEFVETLVYLLSIGKSKVRGTKVGGVQNWSSWRSIILMTGEEPIITSTSQGGISTRVMELYGGPFENEEAAAKMHRLVSEDYGVAGEAFLKALLKDSCYEDELRRLYNEFCNCFKESKGVGVHLHNVAFVAAVDVMVSKILFGQMEAKAMETAVKMGKGLLCEQMDQQSDVSVKAYEYIREWVISNKLQFELGAKPRYGYMEGETFYILPSILEEALTKKGYSYRKTIKAMGERGLIATTWDNTTRRYSIVKRFQGTLSRFIEIRFNDEEESAKF